MSGPSCSSPSVAAGWAAATAGGACPAPAPLRGPSGGCPWFAGAVPGSDRRGAGEGGQGLRIHLRARWGAATVQPDGLPAGPPSSMQLRALAPSRSAVGKMASQRAALSRPVDARGCKDANGVEVKSFCRVVCVGGGGRQLSCRQQRCRSPLGDNTLRLRMLCCASATGDVACKC